MGWAITKDMTARLLEKQGGESVAVATMAVAGTVVPGGGYGVMKRFGNRNDLWDWGVILLLVAGATIALWVGVWVAHAEAGVPRANGIRSGLSSPGAISPAGS
jgi:predicted acyltransferase